MKCTVYRSSKKDYTYIYLRDRFSFEELPATLQDVFGDYQAVMTLDLTPERKLTYEDVKLVIQNLAEQGYHLQLPPQHDATGWLDLPEKKDRLL
jgi:hypothetical protein